MPGLMRQVPGWLLRRDGPLTIRWRHLHRLAPWLWRFVNTGSVASVEAAARALSALHSPSLDLHRELAARAGVPELVKGCDYLHVYTDSQPDRLDSLDNRLRQEHGASLELLDGAALRDVEPALSPRYVQAVRILDQGFAANPSRLVAAYANAFAEAGGRVHQAEVTGFERASRRVISVKTAAGNLDASAVVIAAGPWSTRLTAMLGIKLPLEAERGYHVTLPEPGISISNTIMETGDKFVATPMETGLRLAGTVELASVDAPPDYRRADLILEKGRRMFPELAPTEINKWMGRRPSMPDGLPVIGPAPGHDNVFLAFGHAHTGMIGGPNTGRVIAGMVTGQPLNLDPRPFRAERFAPGQSSRNAAS